MTEGAHVEIVDPRGDLGYPLVPSKVFINGVDVGFVAVDGVSIHVGGSADVTTVTLTLMPRRVTIRGREPEKLESSLVRARYLDRLRARPR